MYYIFMNDILLDVGISEPSNLPIELLFNTGSQIDLSVPNPLVFTTNATGDINFPDYRNSGIPVMSTRLVNVFEEAGVDNLQKYPAVIKSDSDGAMWDDYFAVNIIGIIKCADLEKSKFTETFPGNYDFTKLAINTKKTNDVVLFRLQEDPSTIIIHKSIGIFMADKYPDEEISGWMVDEIIQ